MTIKDRFTDCGDPLNLVLFYFIDKATTIRIYWHTIRLHLRIEPNELEVVILASGVAIPQQWLLITVAGALAASASEADVSCRPLLDTQRG